MPLSQAVRPEPFDKLRRALSKPVLSLSKGSGRTEKSLIQQQWAFSLPIVPKDDAIAVILAWMPEWRVVYRHFGSP